MHIGGQHEHIALAEELFGAAFVKHNHRVGGGGNGESNPSWDVAFDKTGDNFDDWLLSSENEMNAGGAAHLGDADDRGFHLFTGLHHNIGHLVNDDHDIRHFAAIVFLLMAVFVGDDNFAAVCGLLFVIRNNIFYTLFGE